ncbi:TonB-dependent receptor [Elizabethkingia argentiflava]|uniref:TonB-dependent receptor n=1 Tax=Elizabethkingia argenteiflava TaxID=2681556 RepID=A0A845PY88_9FLAO|nr:outer membrane beta-barrel protein [Elizabethkingia argenteiflava]NAW51881.1 TonB-dependent receptor [Elizabethkingia argenteiflava]
MKRITFIFCIICSIFSFSQTKKNDSIQKLLEKEIREVEIKANKKLVEIKGDRLVFNVGNSIAATGGDAMDALKVTPGISVQHDKISMIGKNAVLVMIDDRFIQFSGDELMIFLKTITSDDIKSIEVITNPPVKYDASGSSGIVNIKLRKAKKNSIRGNLKTVYTQATYPLGNLGGGLNYQKGKLTLVSNINYSNGSIAPYQEYSIYYPRYIWFETNHKRSFQNNLAARVALDYQMNPKTTIGLQYSAAVNQPLRTGRNTSYITNNSGVLDSLIVTPSRLSEENKTHSFNFHTLTKMDTLGTQYSIDVDYFNFKSQLDNHFNTRTHLPNGISVPNRFTAANNLSRQNIDIYSAKIDYEMPLKWFDLAFGGKASFMNNNSTVSYFDTTNETPFIDPSKSNIFNYKEQTQVLYISGNKKISEKWDFQAGLRLESTQTKGYSETLHQTHKNNYIKLFPTIYLTYKANDNSTWALNYNRRVDRPPYRLLNPFRYYSSSYNYSEGNPFLQAFFTDNLDISYTYKDFYSSVYFSYLTHGFDQVTYVSAHTISQVVIPSNFYTQKTIGLLENYVFNKVKWWESNNQMTLSYSETLSEIEKIVPSISHWAFTFNSNNAFILNKGKTFRAELNFNYMSPATARSYKISGFYYIDLGMRLSLFAKKLQIAINALDIFKTDKKTFIQVVNGVRQENYDYRDTQKIRISLTYTFSKPLIEKIQQQSNEEEKNRVK